MNSQKLWLLTIVGYSIEYLWQTETVNTSLVRMATLQLIFTTIIQVRESQEDDAAHMDVVFWLRETLHRSCLSSNKALKSIVQYVKNKLNLYLYILNMHCV